MSSLLPKYHHRVLPNGLEVYVVPMDNGSDVISTDIFYKVGSRDEIMGKSGIAHMLEHMNFKSTKNLAEGEFDEIVKRHGGINNASTGFDYTHYFIKSSSKNLKVSLGLFAELMQHLNLSDEEFQRERDVVAEERRWRTDNNPIGYLYFRLFNTHYVAHSYHWTPIGFMDDILNWSIEDIRGFHQAFYRPDNAVIIVSGDIEPDTVFSEVEAAFGAIDNPALPQENVTAAHLKEPECDGAKRITLHKEGNEVDIVAIAYPIPNYEHEDQVALSAISELLSAGKSSRLQQEMITRNHLANSVYAYNLELTDPGIFLFLAVGNPNVSAEKLEEAFMEQIDILITKEVSQEELDKVIINIRMDFMHTLESSSQLSDLFGGYAIRGNLQPLLEYEETLDKMTPKQVKEAARKYFDDTKATTVILRKNG